MAGLSLPLQLIQYFITKKKVQMPEKGVEFFFLSLFIPLWHKFHLPLKSRHQSLLKRNIHDVAENLS
ncbi:hypothetical protein GDO81_014305 [Engystomops pustulosus]|uniref:Uncharacterized protein n=1 Tax=Engystomops pustulosus TaxID=76066 RepID=A0AAV7B9H5_ENGPU|nr:hypothetical protein GDO81_014305 [Engystomops pustulosus]